MIKSPLVTVMSNAAIKVSKGMLRDFGEVDKLQISRKGASNFVTKTDLRAEKMLTVELKKARPDFGFLLEEGGEIKGTDSAHRWIIDPLDGTNNFIHAIPYFCISIALERETRPGLREIVAAVTYDPIHNELFAAERGRGAYLNDRRLSVSVRDNLDQAMLVVSNPGYAFGNSGIATMLKRSPQEAVCIRSTGATALDLAYIAAGRFDAGSFHAALPWDVAAGILLVQEAGGLAIDFSGKPSSHMDKTLLASNHALQTQVTKLLAVSGAGV
jgi:myo-inositol-1(or 4)-monophosphatase